MASSLRSANLLWWGFFIYYSIYKYLASLQVWEPEFAVQVAILALMTAFVPYYLTRLAIYKASGTMRLIAILFLPLAFCAIGYVVFYYTRIVPFFDGVSLQNDVMLRSIFPGVMITGILLFEDFLIKRQTNQVST